MSSIFYPGSFDPLTYGHLDVLIRTSAIFSEVVIGILENVNKTAFFSLEERHHIITKTIALHHIKNVRVISFKGLATDFMKENNIKIMLRGIRVISDFENEMKIAFNNKDLYPEMETLFLFTNPIFGHVSSSTVKEIFYLGGDISKHVPKPSLAMLQTKIKL